MPTLLLLVDSTSVLSEDDGAHNLAFGFNYLERTRRTLTNYSQTPDPYADNWARIGAPYHEAVGRFQQVYYAQTANIDWNIGRIMKALDDRSQTIVDLPSFDLAALDDVVVVHREKELLPLVGADRPVGDQHGPAILREARRSAGLSQRELARRSGIAQPVLSRIERGRASPRRGSSAAAGRHGR